jgi:acetyl-CoA synthetase
MADSVEVERDLEVLLKEEDVFEPPEDFVKQANFSDAAVYDEADKDFEAWWEGWAKELDWFEPWQTVLEWNPPWAKWFQEGKLNASHNCLDRHVNAGKGDKVAYHWVGEDGATRDVTYAEMLDMTKRFANVLKGLGVEKGDVVGIYMPMLPETPAAMLACSRIGATHNVVFGGFSVEAVRERMEVSEAKVLVTADATLRRGKPTPMKANVDEVLDQLPKLEHVVVVNRTDSDCPMQDGRDVWWHEEIEKADAECEPEPLDPSTRSTSSTRPARPRSRRGSCTPPAAT